MKENPRLPREKLVNRWMVALIGLVSLTAGLIAFFSFFIVYKITNDITMARSVAFVTLGLNSLAYVFSVRALMTPFWENHLLENKWLLVAVLAGIGLQVLPFTTPSLRLFFGLGKLGAAYWLIAIGLSIFMFFVIEIFKVVYKKTLKSKLGVHKYFIKS